MIFSDFLKAIDPGKEVSLFVDGACSGNPGPGGWGVVAQQDGVEAELNGGEPNTTNNRMELMAAIEALDQLKDCRLFSITTDSQYLKNGVTQWLPKWKKNGWKTASNGAVKNKDLWIRLEELCENKIVSWDWIKGHNGTPGNEKADNLARQAVVMQMCK